MSSDLELHEPAEAPEALATASSTSESADQSSAQPALDPRQLIGARLRNAREAKGLTEQQVAERLCFTPQRVRDLEQCDFTAISARAYARGYIQSYAKLLQIDPQEIISVFDSIEFPASTAKRSVQLVIRRENNGPSAQIKWFGVGIGLVLLALVGFWWHSARDHANVDSVAPALSAEIPLQKVPLNSNANI